MWGDWEAVERTPEAWLSTLLLHPEIIRALLDQVSDRVWWCKHIREEEHATKQDKEGDDEQSARGWSSAERAALRVFLFFAVTSTIGLDWLFFSKRLLVLSHQEDISGVGQTAEVVYLNRSASIAETRMYAYLDPSPAQGGDGAG